MQTKNGKEYAFADFTLSYSDHKMQEKFITFSTGNVDVVKRLKSLEIGTPLRVAWLPDTREDAQRDRWYPSFSAYGVTVLRDEAPHQQKQREPQYTGEPSPDDLPW